MHSCTYQCRIISTTDSQVGCIYGSYRKHPLTFILFKKVFYLICIHKDYVKVCNITFTSLLFAFCVAVKVVE